MKAKKLIKSFALCASIMLFACEAMAGIIVTQKAVEPGVWTSDYDGAIAYAEKNNVPMFVFWANTGCTHCESVEREMNKEPFVDWMNQRKILMVFVESDGAVKKWIKKYAKSTIKAFPFAAVYWPKNSKGETVLEGFSAYKGNMGRFGANSKDSNIQQIIDTIEFLIPDWDPSGVVPAPDPQPDPDPVFYTVNFVVDAAKGNVTGGGSLSQRVESGKGAVAPIVTPNDGWEFTGWDKSFSKVTANLTVNAKFAAIDPDPAPAVYTVNFVVDAAKGTATGDLSQQVESGKGAVAPIVTPNDGWEFTGWDKSFSKVKENLTVTALFEQIVPRNEIDPAVFFKKAKTLEAVAYQGDELFGKATISLGKYNAKKGYLKATFKIAPFGGRAYSKMLNVVPNEYGDFSGVEVAFKSPIGVMVFDLYNGENGYEVVGEGDDYFVEAGAVALGGQLVSEEMTFTAEFDDLEPENDNYEFLSDMPSVTATVRGGKTLNFGAAPKIAYQKFKEDGETWYELSEFDEDRYPNVNAVRLTYKPTTGVLSGSFKIYASNEFAVDDGKKPTLKTYTAKVSGYVVNGVGIGTVSVKIGKRTYTGIFTLEE